MLASTVKFSKYDRSHIKIPRLPDRPCGLNLVVRGGMWSEVSTLRADPSGPNSVPELMDSSKRGSTLRREVLTLVASIKPNNRRSTSELSCVQTFAVQTAHGQPGLRRL